MEGNKALKVAWLWLVGAVTVIAGVYIYLSLGVNNFTYQTVSFVIMLAGLLLAGVGAIQGKNKLKHSSYFYGFPSQPVQETSETQPQEMPQETQSKITSMESRVAQMLKQQARSLQAAEKKLITGMAATREQPSQQPAKPTQTPQTAQPIQPSEPVQEQPGIKAQTELQPDLAKPSPQTQTNGTKILKVLICPKCGTENNENNAFCYSCGKKLRLKSFKKK